MGELFTRTDEICPMCYSTYKSIRMRGPHIGLYCKVCGKWFKWVKETDLKKYLMEET